MFFEFFFDPAKVNGGRAVAHPCHLRSVGQGVGKPVSAHEEKFVFIRERVKKAVNNRSKFICFNMFLNRTAVGDTLCKLVKSNVVLAVSLLCKVGMVTRKDRCPSPVLLLWEAGDAFQGALDKRPLEGPINR